MQNVADATNIINNSAHVVGNSRYTANICAPHKITDLVIDWKKVIYSDTHFSSISMVHYSESDSTVFSRAAQTNVPWRNINAANTAGHGRKQNTSFLSSVMCTTCGLSLCL